MSFYFLRSRAGVPLLAVLLLCGSASGFAAAANRDYGWTGTNSLGMPKPSDHLLRIISPALLELSLVTTEAAGASPTVWNFVGENFEPKLPAPDAFQVLVNGERIPVTRVGFKRRVLYAPLRKRDLRILNKLYLELGKQLSSSQRVVVGNPDALLWDRKSKWEAVFDALRFSPAIHVNEVGYQPGYPKRAMVGMYLGTLGELAIPRAATFSIIDTASGESVFKGQLKPRPDKGFTYSPPPYQQVFEADFTGFDKPGVYRLAVEGLGASFPFRIDDGTLAAFARTYALGLYHQRCGTNNAFPFTRFVHDACHTAPAEVPDKTFKKAQAIIAATTSDAKRDPRHTAPLLKNTDASLYPFVRHGRVDVSGGHHDAGDYSKYTINSAGLIHSLIFAVDNFDGVAALDNLGIPESGDGISDLAEEAKWEADFLAKLQDDDGGFYFLVYPKEREYEDNVLPEKGDPQIVWPKNTSATAAAVAALAEIGSSPVIKKAFPDAAGLYMQRALRGWAFLERAIAQHGRDGSYQKLTHYGNEFLHDDELGWAAAALFAATGKKEFEQRFIQAFNPEDRNTRRWTWWPMFEGWGNATRTYAFAARSGRLKPEDLDANFLGRCENLIWETAMNHVRWANESAYGTSFPDLNKANMNAGWFFSSERAFDITTAWQLRHDEALRDAVLSNLNYEAGCNPVDMTYITGLGWRRQREIVDQYALNDYRVLPPTGLPLGNVQSGFAYLEPYKKELGALSFPADGAKTAPYPFYDRWGDSFNTSTEFVIVDQGRSLASLAYWMAQTPMRGQKWRSADAAISKLPASSPVGQPITAELNVPGMDLRDAQIVWEARDQEPCIEAAFVFSPKHPGRQWVEAEAMWPDGRRAFAKTMFTATAAANLPPNSFQSANLQPNPDTVALFHLDGNTKDAAGRAPDLVLSGKARFDKSNLSWMKTRSGSALQFSDLGDKAACNLDRNIFASSAPSEISIEAMIYINAFKAYNRANVKILSLSEDWNSSLELLENMYEGPMIKGGGEFSIKKDRLTSVLTRGEWHHLAISLTHDGYSARLDGKEIGSIKSGELANWGRKPVKIEIGNFDGYIDEVAVICKTQP